MAGELSNSARWPLAKPLSVRFIVSDAVPIELLSGPTMPVARIGHLVALKVLSGDDIRRPQDASIAARAVLDRRCA